MKNITHHQHQAEASQQVADTQPGHYYVSAVDGPTYWLLLGPFTQHQTALDHVEAVRALAQRGSNPRAAFVGYGTARKDTSYTQPGTANRYFPELFPA